MQDLNRAIFEWDIVNWSKSRKLWDPQIASLSGEALGIGERGGGLSLYMAKNGLKVVCTDLNDFPETTAQLHQKFKVAEQITYQKESALDLSFDDNSFDLVMFKSVIGALSEKERQQQAINEIYRVLKPGGYLMFAENLEGSALHRYLRKKFVKWEHYWRYLTYKGDLDLFSQFSHCEYQTHGFLGAFGRSEKQRSVLGKMDRLAEKMVPAGMRYILVGVCKK